MHDLSLAVCPHDTIRNTEGWYRLVQFLSHRLGLTLHFTPALDFEDFHGHFSRADLVYANPSDAIRLIDQHGYTPLARPANLYDEALVLASAEQGVQDLEGLRGADLAVVEGLLPTKLALCLLRSKGIEPGTLVARESWLAVVSTLWRNETPFGVVYRDAYDDLSAQSKAMVRVLAATDARCAFHMLCAGPALADRHDLFAALLRSMEADSEGRLVLDDMHIAGWAAVSAEELSRLRDLLV